ncbi:MAG: hypothetical protein JWL93_1077 [Hyphomicrobiales bacterium]|jgi:hypothetical protein|nr:hypothetical protein [Hyphomicrobiales bacterium]
MSLSSKLAVIVWIRHTERFDDIWAALLKAARRDPEADTEYDSGRVFAHWDCDSVAAAQELVTALKTVWIRPEIVYVHVADYTKGERSVTFKDTRFAGA